MELLSAIGYPVADIDAYQTLAELVFDRGTGHKAGENFYLQYHDPSGAELWLQVDIGSAFVGMNPFYVPTRATRVELHKPVFRHEGTMDGAFEATLAGFPIVFDMPDAHMLPPIKLPLTTEVLLSAFLVGPLHLAEVHETVLQHLGLPEDPAHHILQGQVSQVLLRTNRQSGQSFRWIEVGLPGGSIELVASPDDAPATQIRPGDWIKGTCWLVGRVQVSPEAQAHTGFLQRVFWGG
jgi:hypothetical protein